MSILFIIWATGVLLLLTYDLVVIYEGDAEISLSEWIKSAFLYSLWPILIIIVFYAVFTVMKGEIK